MRGDEAPITEADYAKLPDIIAHPDRVSHGGDTRRAVPCIKYEKTMGDTHYFVEEVWSSEKRLVAKTFYKRKAPLRNRATPGGGVVHTSKTDRGARMNRTGGTSPSSDSGGTIARSRARLKQICGSPMSRSS